MEKELLKITIGQMIQLNELGYLSSNGKDFLIQFLITDEKEHYLNKGDKLI